MRIPIPALVMLWLCLWVGWSGGEALGSEYYVALNGDDAQAGTLEKPLATLQGARDQIRALKEARHFPAAGVTVWIRGGRYQITETFTLTRQDSGSKEAPIVYRAYANESVRFMGGMRLRQGWFIPVTSDAILDRVIDANARHRLLQVNLKQRGITDYGELSRHGYVVSERKLPQMELYVNGEPMQLGRWPNERTVTMAQVLDAGPRRGDDDFWDRGGSFRYDFDRPKLWQQADDVWLAGSFRRSWEWTYKKIAQIDAQAKTMTFRAGEHGGLSLGVPSEVLFHAENLLEEIDVPGEYYLDRAGGVLYLFPPKAFAGGNADIMVSMLKTPMLKLDDVSHVTFGDLVFDTGRSTAVACNGGDSVRFEFCEFRSFSNGGLSFTGKNHRVTGCHIHHIGGAVIRIRGGDRETLEAGNNVVENCHIHNFSHWNKVYNPAISVGGVGNRVVHCLIRDGTHMGIQLSGNDHLFEYNEFYRVPEEVTDMAAIYAVLGRRPHERGTVIRRNFFHHIGLSGKNKQAGVYPDNMTFDWLIEENVFYKIGVPQGRSCWAVFNHGGANVTTQNNIFVDCTIPFAMAFPLNSYFKSSVGGYERAWKESFQRYGSPDSVYVKKYPEFLHLLEEDRIFPDTNTYQRNLVYNPATPREFEGAFRVQYGPQEKLQASNNWVALQDPGFVDLENMNLALRNDAEVFQKIPGFNKIPFHKIGLSGPYGPFKKQTIDRTIPSAN